MLRVPVSVRSAVSVASSFAMLALFEGSEGSYNTDVSVETCFERFLM